ncbi:hypothetical protein BaRGS_00038478 [Batillaria attramentaria]|uniref:Uncharacterized protein n=1 Tax=Batillaria attramentaria TaxID=370345 RepID=A0ABD0J620_9CAEN
MAAAAIAATNEVWERVGLHAECACACDSFAAHNNSGILLAQAYMMTAHDFGEIGRNLPSSTRDLPVRRGVRDRVSVPRGAGLCPPARDLGGRCGGTEYGIVAWSVSAVRCCNVSQSEPTTEQSDLCTLRPQVRTTKNNTRWHTDTRAAFIVYLRLLSWPRS